MVRRSNNRALTPIVLLLLAICQEFFSRRSVQPVSIHIISDQSGRPSGQAYVAFNTAEDMNTARELDHEKIGKGPRLIVFPPPPILGMQ